MRRHLTAIAIAAVALAGCGGEKDDGPGPTVTTRAGAPAVIVGEEYSFDPETIVVEGAGKVTLTLKNEGVLAHNLRVTKGAQDLGGTPAFQQGKEKSATLELEPGEYGLVCTVGNHAALGMTGKLTVR